MRIVFTFEYTTVKCTFDPKFTRTAILNTGANEAGARESKSGHCVNLERRSEEC